jgi:carboxylesterase
MDTNEHSYRAKGGRIGVLLIHGLAGTPKEMRYVANGLARAGYTVHCPQLAGHCGSEAELKAATWQDWYASCDTALTALRKECDFVVVGGLSTGAVLAMLLAANRPDDVQATALLAPTLWLNGWMIPWYAHFFKLVFHKRVANMIKFPDTHPNGIKDDRIREFFLQALNGPDSAEAGLANTPGGAVLEHRWLVKHLLPRIGEIEQPTMILHPREDDIADISNAWHIQSTMKGRVEVSVLEDSYHNVTLDRQRHVVVERMAAFITSVVAERETLTEKAAQRAKFKTVSAAA